jgi:hypothetical protein
VESEAGRKLAYKGLSALSYKNVRIFDMTYRNYLPNCQVHLLDFVIYTNSRAQKITLAIQNFATATTPIFWTFTARIIRKY